MPSLSDGGGEGSKAPAPDGPLYLSQRAHPPTPPLRNYSWHVFLPLPVCLAVFFLPELFPVYRPPEAELGLPSKFRSSLRFGGAERNSQLFLSSTVWLGTQFHVLSVFFSLLRNGSERKSEIFILRE